MRLNRVACATLAGIALAASAVNNVHAGDPKAITKANNRFAVDLYRLVQREQGNLIYSPYSIEAAFAMTYAGAKEATAEQMRKALHWQSEAQAVAQGFHALNQSLGAAQAKDKVQWVVANSLWPQHDAPFKQDFLTLVKNQFGTQVFPADFKSSWETERGRINSWVARQTRDKIRDLIPAGALTSLTRLVLCNAIYFKGSWASPFPAAATKSAPFHLASGRETECKLMQQEGQFGYAESPGLKILSLPYGGGDLSMVVLLPEKPGGLAELESQLDAARLDHWVGQLRNQTVKVYLPRFTAQFGLKLNQAMITLGMADAFDQAQADFSGMNGGRDLFISAAFHKAFVEVNEEGTEAAAATGIVVATRAALPKPTPVFRADHPFVFLIRHNATGAILFLGRLSDPAVGANAAG